MPIQQMPDIQQEFASIRQTLIPWLREWGRLAHGEPKPVPPSGVYEGLVALSTNHPKNEAVLRQLLDMQCLMCDRHVAASTLQRIVDLPGNRTPKQRHTDQTRLRNLLVSNPDLLDPILSAIQMTRDDFFALGEFIDRIALSEAAPRSDTYLLTERWVRENLSYDDDQWNELRERMWSNGMYNDFYVRDRYFDMLT